MDNKIIAGCCKNTDTEIWRKIPGDYYSPSILVTDNGAIGISAHGMTYVRTIERWHKLARIGALIEEILKIENTDEEVFAPADGLDREMKS